jgi:hypothetical protein
VVIPANLKIGYESTVLSRGQACGNTRKTRLSIKTERYLVSEPINESANCMPRLWVSSRSHVIK